MSAPFEIQRITVDTVTWESVVAPFPCSRVMLRLADEAADLKIRTDPTDANTEETVPGGVYYRLDGSTPEFSLRDNMREARFSNHVWLEGDVVCAVQATAGTGPLVAAFKQ